MPLLHRLRQSRTRYTLTTGPENRVHFNRWVQAESLAARGFPWEVVGTKAPKDVLKLDGGLTVGLTDAMKFRGSYTSDVSRQTRSHGISLRGDLTF
jgi:hypothetical protein